MLNAAVIGYGNIGRYVVEAILAAPDMKLAGVVRRRESLNNCPPELKDIKVTSNISELGDVDVAIIASPSRMVPNEAEKYLKLGINTVDSFDIHSEIFELRQRLAPIASENSTVSVISAGWDPGSDSVVRALMEAIAPKGITHTNFGEGMSMGHSVAAKSKEGVRDALSLTIPTGTGIHRRLVYVELEDTAEFAPVEKAIKEDPYFVHDDTRIIQTKDVKALVDMGHGVNMVRKGVSGKTHNQFFEFNMKINNPALTSQVLVCCARATAKLSPGCYTMIEIPVIDLLCGSKEELIKRLV